MLKKKVAELQNEMESCNKKLVAQNNIIQEIKDESQKRQDKFQVVLLTHTFISIKIIETTYYCILFSGAG